MHKMPSHPTAKSPRCPKGMRRIPPKTGECQVPKTTKDAAGRELAAVMKTTKSKMSATDDIALLILRNADFIPSLSVSALQEVINSHKEYFANEMYKLLLDDEVIDFPKYANNIFRDELLRNLFTEEYITYRNSIFQDVVVEKPDHPNYMITLQVINETMSQQETIHLSDIPSMLYYALVYGFFGKSEKYIDANNTLCVVVDDVTTQWKDAIRYMLRDLVDNDLAQEYMSEYYEGADNYIDYLEADNVALIYGDGEPTAHLVPETDASVKYYCNQIIPSVETLIIKKAHEQLAVTISNKAGRDDASTKLMTSPLVKFIFKDD